MDSTSELWLRWQVSPSFQWFDYYLNLTTKNGKIVQRKFKSDSIPGGDEPNENISLSYKIIGLNPAEVYFATLQIDNAAFSPRTKFGNISSPSNYAITGTLILKCLKNYRAICFLMHLSVQNK